VFHKISSNFLSLWEEITPLVNKDMSYWNLTSLDPPFAKLTISPSPSLALARLHRIENLNLLLQL
jgi:hypothetical protein